MSNSFRCFIGLSIPDDIKTELSSIQETIKLDVPIDGRYTSVDNMHLTLKFIGDITHSDYELLKNKLDQVKVSCLKMSMGKINYFTVPCDKQPYFKIIYNELKGAEALHEAIVDSIADLDFIKKEDNFVQHLTLLRPTHLKIFSTKKNLVNAIDKISASYNRMNFDVMEFHVFSSTLEKGKDPVYTIVDTFRLQPI